MPLPNDSASGGYVVPTILSPIPAYDAALDAQIAATVVAITGINGEFVRPRWQPTPPAEPGADVDWCAIGVMGITPNANAAMVHHPDGVGFDESQRQEDIEVLASFYGPDAYANASLFRDGIAVPQNRETMYAEGLFLVSTEKITLAPALINNMWRRKADVPLLLRRAINRIYPIRNIITANGAIQTDQGPVVAGEDISVVENWETSMSPFIDRSGTIAAGGVSQVLAPANTLRLRLIIQNPATATTQGIATAESLFFNFTTLASESVGNSIELTPGNSFDTGEGAAVTSEVVNVVAATTGHRFTAKEL